MKRRRAKREHRNQPVDILAGNQPGLLLDHRCELRQCSLVCLCHVEAARGQRRLHRRPPLLHALDKTRRHICASVWPVAAASVPAMNSSRAPVS